MSQQCILFIFACVIFQAANAMNKPIDTQQPGSRFALWKNYCLQRSEEHRQEFLKGYNSHLQQAPVSQVRVDNREKKVTPTS